VAEVRRIADRNAAGVKETRGTAPGCATSQGLTSIVEGRAASAERAPAATARADAGWRSSPDIGVFTTDASWSCACGTTGSPRRPAARRRRARQAAREVVPDLAARGLLRYFHEALATGAIQVLAPAFHHYLIRCRRGRRRRRFARCSSASPSARCARTIASSAPWHHRGRDARMEAERDIADALASADPDVRRRAAEALATSRHRCATVRAPPDRRR
jgi:hypothetical protein